MSFNSVEIHFGSQAHIKIVVASLWNKIIKVANVSHNKQKKIYATQKWRSFFLDIKSLY
jgi:hypothetical protein